MGRIDHFLIEQSDDRIIEGLNRLVTRERRRKADFLAYLNEVDRRRLYAVAGYSCPFKFLVGRYNLSESTALKRIVAARLVRRFPLLYYDVEEGTFSYSALVLLSKHLNDANAMDLLGRCRGQSIRHIKEVIAREFPQADIEDRVHQTVAPLSVDRVGVQFTADKAFEAKLELAKATLSKRFPQGKLAEIFGYALDCLLEAEDVEVEPNPVFDGEYDAALVEIQKAGTTAQLPAPKAPDVMKHTRYIPRRIRNIVNERDGRCCQYVGPGGKICGETRFLQIDHVTPYCVGGSSQDPNNLRLLCWAHNQLVYERFRDRFHS